MAHAGELTRLREEVETSDIQGELAAAQAEAETLREELATLEAQAAAMRDALHLADGLIEHSAECEVGFEANTCTCDQADIQDAIEAALAPEAGATFRNLVRAETLEEAAQVAENFEPPENDYGHGPMIATALRELKGEA